MKILALDKTLPGVTMEQILPHLEEEASHAWKMYKSGVYRELYMRGDRPGAAIVLECESIKEAKEFLAELPLVKYNLIEFEVIPLQAFTPFEKLFQQ
jgi:hypothetical protein